MLGLVAAGTGLGAVMASFVDPVPRRLDGSPALVSARPEFSGAQSTQFAEVGPENLNPPSLPVGYAPDWADVDDRVWLYPEPALAAWEPAPYPDVAELDAQLAEDAALLGRGAESDRLASREPTGEAPAPEAPPSTEPHLAALY